MKRTAITTLTEKAIELNLSVKVTPIARGIYILITLENSKGTTYSKQYPYEVLLYTDKDIINEILNNGHNNSHRENPGPMYIYGQ